MPIDWTLPMDEEDRAALAEIRRRFAGCCKVLRESGFDPDRAHAAVSEHIAATTLARLPPKAQSIWADRIARALKADPAKPLPARAVGAIRSWPATRVTELGTALAEIEAILEETENDAHHEAIYVEISRAYS